MTNDSFTVCVNRLLSAGADDLDDALASSLDYCIGKSAACRLYVWKIEDRYVFPVYPLKTPPELKLLSDKAEDFARKTLLAVTNEYPSATQKMLKITDDSKARFVCIIEIPNSKEDDVSGVISSMFRLYFMAEEQAKKTASNYLHIGGTGELVRDGYVMSTRYECFALIAFGAINARDIISNHGYAAFMSLYRRWMESLTGTFDDPELMTGPTFYLDGDLLFLLIRGDGPALYQKAAFSLNALKELWYPSKGENITGIPFIRMGLINDGIHTRSFEEVFAILRGRYDVKESGIVFDEEL